MRQFPGWVRVLVSIGIIVAVVLPILVYLLNNPSVSMKIPILLRYATRPIISSSYSVRSEVPGYDITLSDTRYLDYVIAQFKIFDKQSIVDSRVYHGFPDIKLKYTVTHIQFVLVPKVDTPLVFIPGQTKFIGMSDYQVDKNTLIIRVSLDFTELKKQPPEPNILEDIYMRTAIPIMYYAHGLSDGATNSSTFALIRRNIRSYLNEGLFGWPIRIKAK